jgi:hypothetical protein
MNPDQTTNPMELTVGQQFEVEKMGRVIDSTTDYRTLQALCKQLLQAWMSQKAATAWIIRENLPGRPNYSRVTLSDDAKESLSQIDPPHEDLPHGTP